MCRVRRDYPGRARPVLGSTEKTVKCEQQEVLTRRLGPPPQRTSADLQPYEGSPRRVSTKGPVLQSISYPTLRQTRLRDEPVAAMCVRKSSARRVLQFTPFNAASCVLHRPASRVIHRLQLFCFWFLLIAQRGVQVRDLKRRPRLRATTAKDPERPSKLSPPS